MKIFYKYINDFNSIIVAIKNLNVTKVVKEKDLTLLYSNQQIVGLNIFNIKEKNLDNNKIKEIINPILKKYFPNLVLEKQFIIVKIIECEKISNTHLSKCVVETGTEKLQIICGAKNAKKNIYTTLATIESWLNNGIQIKKSKLNGFDSYGMLCSAKELNIFDSRFNSEGIMEWNVDDSFIGKSIWEVLDEK